MKVVIAGTRYRDKVNRIPFGSVAQVDIAVKNSGFDVTEVVSGKAIGIDTFGEHWAIANDLPINEKPANWTKYGKRAGHIRNGDMADYADAAIIIWDGVSTGSKNMIQHMIDRKKPYHVELFIHTPWDTEYE